MLSKAALVNGWLAGGVMRGLDEEGERRHPLLLPIRLDEAVLEAKETWARRLRGQRKMIDFTRWREHEAYRKGLERLLGELQIEAANGPR